MTIAATATSERLGAPTPATRRWGHRVGRFTLASGLVVATLSAAVAAWLAIGDDADADELSLALRSYDIAVSVDGNVLTIAPTATGDIGIAIAFLPGTRIEPDAYVATWAPIVEATGVTVHLAAVPLNLPVLADDPIGDIIEAHPETSTWIVGGHSMGGFEAAAYAAEAGTSPAGLLLWGSGPARSQLADVDLPALVVAGASDTVLPLERALDEGTLPVDATIEVIDGMVHGQFGRYSDTESPTDPARRSNADTLTDLVAVTVPFVDDVATSSR